MIPAYWRSPAKPHSEGFEGSKKRKADRKRDYSVGESGRFRMIDSEAERLYSSVVFMWLISASTVV
jgi:hypothetical protein